MSYQAGLPPHRPPEPPAAPRNALIVVCGVVSLLCWLGVGIQIVIIVPRIERTFAEFRMILPLLTEWVIHDSRWAVPAVTIATLVACIAFGRRSSWPWLFLLIWLPLIINILVAVSLYFPYMELLEGLQGGGKK